MKHEIIKLGPDKNATLEVYCSARLGERTLPPKPAMIVVPGGGYVCISDLEGEPVARAFSARGFNTFVLNYSVDDKAVFPRPVLELSEAVAHVKRHSEEYDINPERVFLCGFSAGGHLAAYLGSMWDDPTAAFPGMKPGENRPCATILGYPGIMMAGEYACNTDSSAVLGYEVDVKTNFDADIYSVEKLVSDKTVPAFIWHTLDDGAVPAQNEMAFVTELLKRKIPYEYHCFGRGYHGLSLANEETWGEIPDCKDEQIALWPELVMGWIKKAERFGDFEPGARFQLR